MFNLLWKCNNSKNSDIQSSIQRVHLFAKNVASVSQGKRHCCPIQRYVCRSVVLILQSLIELHDDRCTVATRYTNATVAVKYFGIWHCCAIIRSCSMPVRTAIPSMNRKTKKTFPIRKRTQSTVISTAACVACHFIVPTYCDGTRRRTSNTIMGTMCTRPPNIVATFVANRLLKL